MPILLEAVEAAQALGRCVEVKNVPECLLGTHSDILVNDQPELMIDPAFWNEFARNNFERCIHRAYCGTRRCLGLTDAYVKKFGWEEDFVSPIRPG
jgi:hypothetical protein